MRVNVNTVEWKLLCMFEEIHDKGFAILNCQDLSDVRQYLINIEVTPYTVVEGLYKVSLGGSYK